MAVWFHSKTGLAASCLMSSGRRVAEELETKAPEDVTLKLTEFETEVGMSLSKYHVCTETLAAVGLSNKLAGITAVS